MAKTRSKKLLESDKFRATVMALRLRADIDWHTVEDNFLETQARRPDDYIFSKDQRKFLNRLIAVATIFSTYSEYSVRELITMTYPYRFEHPHFEDEQFLRYHYEHGTTALPVREVRRLAALYRRRESLQRDESVEAVFDETWTDETSLLDYDSDWSKVA
jgi:hypothetical protein